MKAKFGSDWILIALAGVCSLGCSSSNTGTGGPEANPVDDAGVARHDASGAGSFDSGPPAPHDSGAMDAEAGISDSKCATQGNNCIQCCQTNHPSGAQTFIGSTTMCECTTPGICKTPCAKTYCAAMQLTPDQQCGACLSATLDPDAGGECYQAIASACSASADCSAYVRCAATCP